MYDAHILDTEVVLHQTFFHRTGTQLHQLFPYFHAVTYIKIPITSGSGASQRI